MMNTRSRYTTIVLTALFILLVPTDSPGSVIVFDPTNFGVNLEQVAHHLELIARLDRQIRHQLRMLENWRFTRLEQALMAMQRIQGVVEQVADLDVASNYSIAVADYDRLEAAAISSLRRARLESHRAAVITSQAAQQEVVTQMPAAQQRIREYVQHARSAPGQTAVLQATNETLATLTSQLQSAQALELAQNRVEIEAEARRQAEAVFHRQRRDALMRDWTAPGAVASVYSRPVRSPFRTH